MAKTLTPPEALHRAAALCSSSEHCIADIREKLSRWGIGEPDARTIVEPVSYTHLDVYKRQE